MHSAALILLLATATADPAPVDYATQIKPIFTARCLACHGALKQEAGLRLDTGASARAGGDSGAAVTPGQPADSLLIHRVSATDLSERMPPEGEPLTAEQIALLTAWVQQNALSPADEAPEPDPRDHWAFRLPVRPAVPVVNDAAWVRNPIDAFIAAQHEQHNLAPLPAAPPEVLLRRVHLDLVGLPPTRAELHAFLADPSPTAYAAIVDDLLSRPQHGERWARHWMDVWRYSDWYGRRYVNDVRNSFPHIWRWRDWIVNSLNSDKGYDDMVREMLAADELSPDNDDTVVATGFIARNWYSLNYDQWMRDLVEHTGKAFLGLRTNCALCHDHKYDPLTQEEYFKLRAFFEPLEMRHDRVPGGPALPKLLRYTPGSGASLSPTAAGLARVYEETPDAQTFMYSMGDQRLRMDRPPVTPGTPAFLGGDPLDIKPIELPPVAWYPGLKPFAQQAELDQRRAALTEAETKAIAARTALAAHVITDDAAAKQHAALTADAAIADAHLASATADLAAMEARIAADQVRYLGTAGDMDSLARVAARTEREFALAAANEKHATAAKTLADARAAQPPDAEPTADLKKAEEAATQAQAAIDAATTALEADTAEYTPLGPIYKPTSTGRRTALAHWITSDRNPLTARVAVNHVWLRHFGRPLVDTVYDFGRAGTPATHPALLDWLAVELMEHDWSLQHLHRLIVTSSTYQLSSSPPADHPNLALDRDNRWWWRADRKRMEAELVRDSLLAVSGLLDPTLGGQELDTPLAATSPRRSLYFVIHPEAGGSPAFLSLFDAPDPTDCYRRTESIVPQQALALTNSQTTLNASRRLAATLSAQITANESDESQHETAFIHSAFEQVLARPVTEAELTRCLTFLEQQHDLFTTTPTETLTGATTEGITPASTNPTQRARESLIRVLFSHHEFVTVR